MAVTSIAPVADATLDAHELARMDAYWRAANYLSVGQIYLKDNPLLREPLALEHVKPRLLGHWGTTPGPEPHLRAPQPRHPATRPRRDLHHRARARRARRWSPTPTSRAPTARSTRTSREDADGMRRLFKQFSFPGGIPSHVAPETPGSIHEGGELGYALSHAFGAAFDNPRPGRRVRDRRRRGRDRPAGRELALEQVPRPGRATARCCRSCTSTATRSPTRRCSPGSSRRSSRACWSATAGSRTSSRATTRRPCTGRWPRRSTRRSTRSPRSRPRRARAAISHRPRWPMIVLRTPKGWTGPKEVDGQQIEDHSRSHQVPLAALASRPDHLEELEAWMRSYRPEELFDADGGCVPELRALAPGGRRGAWARTRTPTAGSCCATCGCPTSATSPSTSRAGRDDRRGHARARRLPAAT